ncbi:MAG: hypothetical protein ACJAQT_000244 [Akkermansiaceae bacterium]|jgi:hypothetical protein
MAEMRKGRRVKSTPIAKRMGIQGRGVEASFGLSCWGVVGTKASGRSDGGGMEMRDGSKD